MLKLERQYVTHSKSPIAATRIIATSETAIAIWTLTIEVLGRIARWSYMLQKN